MAADLRAELEALWAREVLRDRVLSGAEVACAAWIVIGHNVFRQLPNEVPTLAIIALVTARLMRGGFTGLGFRRPSSWRLVIGLALGFVAARWMIGAAIEPLTAHFWPAIKAPQGADSIVGNPLAALAALGIVWAFTALGEEIGYRGLIMGRAAQALGARRAAWIAGLLLSAVLFGFGHVYKGPAGVLDSGIAGLLLGGVYLLSGRCMWACILAHGLSDTLAVAVTYLGLNTQAGVKSGAARAKGIPTAISAARSPMFAEPPPVFEPPAITVQQQSDLDCLSIGAVLANATHNAGPNPWASRLVRVYLGRLRSSDPSKEWLRMTLPEGEMSYGWFLSHLRDCQRPLRPTIPRPAPVQAAPPPPPVQPTGG